MTGNRIMLRSYHYQQVMVTLVLDNLSIYIKHKLKRINKNY